MFRQPFLARGHALAALVAAASLIATGCTKGLPDQSGAKLTVTATQPTGTFSPGDDVAFRITVTNAGSSDVSHLSIGTTLAAGLNERSLTCSPLGASAATPGPATCSEFMYLLTLAKGASITLDVVATVGANATGTLTSTATASVVSGPPDVTGTTQVTVLDVRGGNYTAFASDGQRLDVAADFVARTLTFGTGTSAVAAPFTPQSTDASNLFSAQAGFMAHRDLLVGTAPLNGATPVFLAARSFVTSAAALDGHAFNVFGIDTPTGAAATSSFQSVAFSGTTMQVCDALAPYALASCPVSSLRSYALSVAGNVFTGVDAIDSDTVTFQVAQSGSTLVFLRAEATATGQAFRVGLSTNSGIVADQLLGGDNAGHWDRLSLTPTTLEEDTFGEVSTPLGTTLTTAAGQPAGLANGLLPSGTGVFLAEDGGLAVVLGARNVSGVGPRNGDGLIQVFAH